MKVNIFKDPSLVLYILALLFGGRANSQTIINGSVVGADNEPLPATSVTLASTQAKITVDEFGKFNVAFTLRADTLHFRHIGYLPKSVPVSPATESPIRIRLDPIENKLEAVEINTGYYTVPRERATGSFTYIDEELLSRSVSTNLLDRLEGVTHSLLFDRRNLTGEDIDGEPELRIRGVNTIEGNSAPLIVLDNYPFEGDITAINPNEIQDITVLRDAAAASIWGARAGNGVIVINTKKGRYNQPTQVSFSGSVNIINKPDLFFSQNHLPSPSVMQIQKERFEMGGYQEHDQIYLPGYVELLIKRRDGMISDEEFLAEEAYMSQTDLREQSLAYLYQPAVNQQYSFGSRGGGSNYKYSISAGYDKNDGTNVGDSRQRFNIGTQNTFKVGSRLEFNGALWYAKQHTVQNGSGYIRTAAIYEGLVDRNGQPKSITGAYRLRFLESAPALGLLDWMSRPLDEIKLQDHQVKSEDIRLSGSAAFSLFKNLKVTGSYQHTLSSRGSVSLYDKESIYVRNLVNRFTQQDGSLVIPYNGILDHGASSDLQAQSGRLLVNYANRMSETSELTLLAGGEISQSIEQTKPGSRLYGFDKDRWTGNSALDYETRHTVRPSGRARIPFHTLSPNKFTNRTLSYFANGSYEFQERFILTSSVRWDASNLLGVKTNQRGVGLWSVGGSWEMSKEPFLNWAFLPYLRVRSTYGNAGNIDKGQSFYPTVSLDIDGITGLPNATLSSPGNPSLRWEQVSTWNLGLDWSTAKNRLSGSLEYYAKKSTHLLGNNLMDPTTGISMNSQYKMNYGAMRTVGWDVMINSANIVGDFNWKSTLLVSGSQNEILEYNGPVQQSALNYMTNRLPEPRKSLDVIYALPWYGLDGQRGMPIVYVNNEQSLDYNDYLLDLPIDSLLAVGSVVPKVFGSLRNSISWKGFEISALVVFKAGHVFRRPSMAPGAEYIDNFHLDYFQRWQKPGDEKFTQVPAKANNTGLGGTVYLYSQQLITKGDVIRLQDITISYSLPTRNRQKLRMNRLKVFAYARNLGILWRANNNGLDPDYPHADYPAPRRIAIGIQGSF